MTRDPDTGVSLLNTLVVVAIGAGVLQTMLASQDAGLADLEQAQGIAQAESLAQAGIASVASALRQDHRDAPETDHLQEAWAQAAQTAIALDFGRFEVALQDAQGRIDLNALLPANLGDQRLFSNLLTLLDLPQVLGAQITQIVAQNGPLRHRDDLARFGVLASDLERLRPHITALPQKGTININAASETVLAALFEDASIAQILAKRRAAKGFLEPSDLLSIGVVLPNLSGFTSNAYDAQVTVEVGLARVSRHQRLLRDPETGAIQTLPLK